MVQEEFVDALLSLPRMRGPEASPDGHWVAWTWTGLGPAADVYAAPTDGTSPPVRLTDTAESTWLVSWTPDSTGVIVEQDRSGDEHAAVDGGRA